MKKIAIHLSLVVATYLLTGVFISVSEIFKDDIRTMKAVIRVVDTTKRNLALKDFRFSQKIHRSYQIQSRKGELFLVINSELGSYKYSQQNPPKGQPKTEMVYSRPISVEHKLNIWNFFTPNRVVTIGDPKLVLIQFDENTREKHEVFDSSKR